MKLPDLSMDDPKLTFALNTNTCSKHYQTLKPE